MDVMDVMDVICDGWEGSVRRKGRRNEVTTYTTDLIAEGTSRLLDHSLIIHTEKASTRPFSQISSLITSQNGPIDDSHLQGSSKVLLYCKSMAQPTRG